MILLQRANAFEIVDISGHTCTTFPTQKNYVQIIGNPHNDEYYFAGLSEDGEIDSFDFSIKWNRRKRN